MKNGKIDLRDKTNYIVTEIVNLQDMFLDLAGKYIDAAQNDQIVTSAGDLVHTAHAACSPGA